MSCREPIPAIEMTSILSLDDEDFPFIVPNDAEYGGVESWLAHSIFYNNIHTFVTKSIKSFGVATRYCHTYHQLDDFGNIATPNPIHFWK
jgi:hypothetical protein